MYLFRVSKLYFIAIVIIVTKLFCNYNWKLLRHDCLKLFITNHHLIVNCKIFFPIPLLFWALIPQIQPPNFSPTSYFRSNTCGQKYEIRWRKEKNWKTKLIPSCGIRRFKSSISIHPAVPARLRMKSKSCFRSDALHYIRQYHGQTQVPTPPPTPNHLPAHLVKLGM